MPVSSGFYEYLLKRDDSGGECDVLAMLDKASPSFAPEVMATG